MRLAFVLAVSLFACGPSSKPSTTTPPPAETGSGETGSTEPGSGSDTAPTEPGQCMCTMQYDPVCGADGKTYGNACAAGCAKAEVKSKGECPAS